MDFMDADSGGDDFAKPITLPENHWRFRIVEWAFEEGSLFAVAFGSVPNCAYTSYCPLFHLSNGILLISPLIFLGRFVFKTMQSSTQLAKKAGKMCSDLAGERVKKFISDAKHMIVSFAHVGKTASDSATLNEEQIASNKAREANVIFKTMLGKPSNEWADIRWRLRYDFTFLTDDDILEAVKNYGAKIIAARDKAVKRKANQRRRMYAFLNTSKSVMKGIIFCIYAIFAFAAFCTVVVYAPPAATYAYHAAIDTVSWLFTADYVQLLFSFLYYLSCGVIAVTLAVILASFACHVMWPAARSAARSACPAAFNATKSIFCGTRNMIGGAIQASAEFVSMFYITHCPPIVIVNEEDAKLDDIANGGNP